MLDISGRVCVTKKLDFIRDSTTKVVERLSNVRRVVVGFV